MTPSTFDGFTLALAVATGAIALLLTRHLRTPGIVGLLLTGVAIGPDGLAWINPNKLGDGLRTIVSLAVAVILFEGGLNLKINQLMRRADVIRRLITTGAFVTAIGGALAARLILGWDWQTSMLFGTLIIVTGPTVVTPLLRQIGIKRNLKVILEAEGILIDPIGAIIAVVTLDLVITSTVSSGTGHWAWGIWYVCAKLGLGLLLGLGSGLVIGWLLRHDEIVPDDMRNILTLSWVLLVYELSNFIQHESGLMTVIVAGMVVGNLNTKRERELMEFNDQLTIMLIGMLFILLAADVRLANIKSLGNEAWLVVLTVMLVIRPIGVALCTWGTTLSWQERIFMSWLAPRGIVAAAVASLFAFHLKENAIPGGEVLRGMVFMVIAGTVVLQGFTAGPLASLLNLRQKRDDGYVIVGASPLSRLLAHTLNRSGETTTLIDRNDDDCNDAEREGLTVVYGNALEDRVLYRAAIETRRGIVALTPNEGVNVMALRKASIVDRTVTKYLPMIDGSQLAGLKKSDVDAHLLFGMEFDYDLWIHHLRHHLCKVHTWISSKQIAAKFFLEAIADKKLKHSFLVLAVDSRKGTAPFHRSTVLQAQDTLFVLVDSQNLEAVQAWFEGVGVKPPDKSDLPI